MEKYIILKTREFIKYEVPDVKLTLIKQKKYRLFGVYFTDKFFNIAYKPEYIPENKTYILTKYLNKKSLSAGLIYINR